MSLGRGDYFSALSTGGILDRSDVDSLLGAMASRLRIEEVPPELLRSTPNQAKITEQLSRLPLRVARGPKSWQGLVIGFPGKRSQLTTRTLGTPYLRMLLYPVLDLKRRISEHYEEEMRCLYLLGVRFPEVVLRKFMLLDDVIPHIIVLTTRLMRERGSRWRKAPSRVDERWIQDWLRRRMMAPEGLPVPVEGGEIRLAYLSHEFATSEGTFMPERLDILGVDKEDKSLVAFEIKGPDASRVDLENVFLQGLDHRQWLERNKMAVKFALDGPRGRRINTKRRVRLLLGFFQDVPDLFWEMREEVARGDRYLKIDFVGLSHSGGLGGEVELRRRQERTDLG